MTDFITTDFITADFITADFITMGAWLTCPLSSLNQF